MCVQMRGKSRTFEVGTSESVLTLGPEPGPVAQECLCHDEGAAEEERAPQC